MDPGLAFRGFCGWAIMLCFESRTRCRGPQDDVGT